MYKRLLVAVDGSDTSNKALVAALELAREGGGRVLLFHAIDDLPYVSNLDLYAGSAGDVLGIVRQNGERVLREARAIAESAGVAVDDVLDEKFGERLGDMVAAAATRWQADLIVLGTHGRRGFGRMVLGSGAEQIIRAAPVAVLVIRNHGATAA